MAKDDILSDAKEAFSLCEEAENHNRIDALEDLRFARLSEQWPETIRQSRVRDGRPCLVHNMMPAFIRQVVNDSRQNRPAIKVHPVDSAADPVTADIYNGLIRNIEQTSKADVAYDTSIDFAASCGFGYFRISTDYAYDDSFDLDLRIERIANPFSVYGDPYSTASDSADWNTAFVTEMLSLDAFNAKYKGADEVSWSSDGYDHMSAPWVQDKSILVAEWWQREKVKRTILMLSNGSVLAEGVYAKQKDVLDAQGVTVMGERLTNSHKVTQKVLTGAEVLEENDWAGKYIPLVPVYGDEVNVEGKRHFRSLIRDAKDAQRMFNYFRTASVELTALAPRVPFIGKKGTFKSDARKWASVNSQNHAFVEYDGEVPPQRQPLDAGPAIGSITEAANATSDMKSIIGLYNASLGAEGNETSGKAIIARQMEGDTSNFHFIDNLSRAIAHGGRILIDLIPTVYSGQRMIRVLGPDYKLASNVQLGGPMPTVDAKGMINQAAAQPQAPMQPSAGLPPAMAPQLQGPPQQAPQQPGQVLPMSNICDLARGKYDLTVEVGPAYGTKRAEAADQMMTLIQQYPAAAPIIGDLIAKNLDWPDADVIAKRLQAMLPPQLQGIDEGGSNDPLQHPIVQQIMQQGAQTIQTLQQQVGALNQQLTQIQQDKSLEAQELQIKGFEAQTDRMKAISDMAKTPTPSVHAG